MIDLSKLVEILNKVPSFIISKQNKEVLVEKSKILYELNEFIREKYNTDAAGAEYKFREFLSVKNKDGVQPNIKTVIGWAGEFSRSEGFPKADEFEDSLKTVLDILGPLANLGKS